MLLSSHRYCSHSVQNPRLAMQELQQLLDRFLTWITEMDPLMLVPLSLILIVGIIAQWMLYDKAGLRGIACVVPIWNVVEFMKIMGRPGWHALFIMIPPPAMLLAYVYLSPPVSLVVMGVFGLLLAAFVLKVYIELCHCFGRRGVMDYVLVILLNGLYVLWLGLSEWKYHGPVYGSKAKAGRTAAAGA